MDDELLSLDDTPQADSIGLGLAIGPDGDVGVVLMLSDTEQNDKTLGTIVLNKKAVVMIKGKLSELIDEMEMADEAVRTMGTEAAREYLNNWARRINQQLN
jgi:hypothetical protein